MKLSGGAILLFFCGALGGLTGFYFAHPQVAIEPAQIYSQLVVYPTDNTFFIYQRSAWTIIHQLCAVALEFGVKEETLSVILATVIGALFSVGLALWSFSLSGSFVSSAITTVTTDILVYYPWGFHYGLDLFGSQHTYGMLGLAWGTVAAGMLANGSFFLSGLFLGMYPSIHPALAILYGLSVIPSCFIRSRGTAFPKKLIGGLFTGVVVSGGSLVFHLFALPEVAKTEPPSNIKNMIEMVLTHLDGHRPEFNLASGQTFFVSLMAIFCFALFTHFQSQNNITSARASLTASMLGFLSLSLWCFSDLATPFTEYIKIIMPSRLLNSLMLLGIPISISVWFRLTRELNIPNLLLSLGACFLIGIYGNAPNEIYTGFAVLWLIGFFLLNPFGIPSREIIRYLYVIILCYLVLATAANYSYSKTFLGFMVFILVPVATIFLISRKLYGKYKKDDTKARVLPSNFTSTTRKKIQMQIVLALFAVVHVPTRVEYWRRGSFRNGIVEQKSEFFEYLQKGTGILAVSHGGPGMQFFQLFGRRPILIEVSALNYPLYGTSGLPLFLDTLKDVYGLDLFQLPKDFNFGAYMPESVVRPIWESRTPCQWKKLSEKYLFQELITTSDWSLKLPISYEQGEYRSYLVPDLLDSDCRNF